MSSGLVIRLHSSSGLFGSLIRWQTRSRYSHASIEFPNEIVIEAREGCGVHSLLAPRPSDDETVDRFLVHASEYQVERVRAFCLDQLGKPYDWTMVLRFISRRQESRKSRGQWFCSELVFAACLQAGIVLLRDTQPWEVSPGLLARSPFLHKL
jgi:uncharacterized protein YycO